MRIPTNLLSVNTSQINQVTGDVSEVATVVNTVNTGSATELKNRLSTSVPTVDITESIGTLSSEITAQYSSLDIAIPDSLLQGNAEQVQQRLEAAAALYLNGLPTIPSVPALSSLIPVLPQITIPRPSYGVIKDFIERKMEELSRRRQEAFIESQKSLITEAKDGFSFRNDIANKTKSNLSNVLTRQI